MFVATFPLIVLFAAIAIVNSNAATTNAFVLPSTTTSRCCTDSQQQLWTRAFIVPTADKAASTKTSKETKLAAANGGGGGTTSDGFWDRLESMLFAPLEIETDDGSDNFEDPRLVLAEWENLWEETEETIICNDNDNDNDDDGLDENRNNNATAAATAAVDSLTNFLEVWAQISLQNDKGLTTPVSSTKFKTNIHAATAAAAADQEVISGDEGDGRDDDHAGGHYQNSTSSSMKLIFRPPKRYLSYKEQKSMEKNGAMPDRKGAKVDAWSPGGVEIQVTMMTTTTTTATKTAALGTKMNQNQIMLQQQRTSILGIIARRCDIDGDTVVKKTTERTIVRRLENAIRIWKKSNSNHGKNH
jgi:hypothetical protein